ncbi:hypothetical protein HU200_064591 [Digitaria exilis]|uniref:Uncharacterized protein n=1 Tax=Digitaria exilis TaxID=1010633 RepID=A0A835DU83_9POAL|nr:hypothetical protein HU200_064591 [Digitaria exilis]
MVLCVMSPGDDKLVGLEETREACCGCLSKGMACATPERHVWWDLYTPTDAVATFLADWSCICTPLSPQQLVAAHGHGLTT